MMKKIVEKIFFVHCPARGSVFALTLLFFGSWMCFSASIAAWGWELPEKISWRAFWTIRNGEQLFFLLLPLLFAGYFLLMLMRFLKSCPRSCRIGEKTPLLYGILFVFLAGVIVTGAFAVTDILTGLAEIKSGFMYGRKIFFPGGWSVPLSYAGMTAVILLWAVTVHWMAHLAGISFFKILGKASTGLIVLFLAAYSFSLAAAMEASRKTEEKFKTLEQLLDTPLTGRELFKYYTFPSREAQVFQERFSALAHDLENYFLSNRETDILISYPYVNFPEKNISVLQKQLENSLQLKQLEKMLDLPVPSPCRLTTPASENNSFPPDLEEILRYQIWRIRLAIQKKNRRAALENMKRLESLAELTCSKENHFFRTTFVKIEKVRLRCMERLLNSDVVQNSDLHNWQEELRKKDEEFRDLLYLAYRSMVLEKFNRIYRMTYGLDLNQKKCRNDLYAARFLLPELWRRCTLNRQNLADICFVKICRRKTKQWINCNKAFSREILFLQKQLVSLFYHYQVMRVVIEVELNRRQTGKLQLPVHSDIFPGGNLCAKKGLISRHEDYFDPEEERIVCRRSRRSGIAVWSVGLDGRDDFYSNRCPYRPYPGDDILYVLYAEQ